MNRNLHSNSPEHVLGNILRYGVIFSILITFIGGGLYLHQHGASIVPNYGIFTKGAAEYTHLAAIIKGLRMWRPASLIQLGIVSLVATPIIRVILSLILFFLKGDKLYVLITCMVLGIIFFSMLGGVVG